MRATTLNADERRLASAWYVAMVTNSPSAHDIEAERQRVLVELTDLQQQTVRVDALSGHPTCSSPPTAAFTTTTNACIGTLCNAADNAIAALGVKRKSANPQRPSAHGSHPPTVSKHGG